MWSGERVERTNARGRHRYVPGFKSWMVEQALRPGMSTAGLAMRNQVNANQLRRWVMLHQRAGTAPAPMLLPVTVAAPTVALPNNAQRDDAIEIDVAGVTVRVRSGVEPTVLRKVLEVLRGIAT